MPTDSWWLEPSTVTAVLGSAMSEVLDAGALEQVCTGVRAWVESRRGDLINAEVTPAVFEPTPDVTLGAAMLAWRIYKRRETPLGILGATEDGYTGILRDDPDIARFLGIGAAGGRFVFGGYNPSSTAVS